MGCQGTPSLIRSATSHPVNEGNYFGARSVKNGSVCVQVRQIWHTDDTALKKRIGATISATPSVALYDFTFCSDRFADSRQGISIHGWRIIALTIYQPDPYCAAAIRNFRSGGAYVMSPLGAKRHSPRRLVQNGFFRSFKQVVGCTRALPPQIRLKDSHCRQCGLRDRINQTRRRTDPAFVFRGHC
jgi:hypothetical protein